MKEKIKKVLLIGAIFAVGIVVCLFYYSVKAKMAA